MPEWRETTWGDVITLQRGFDITKDVQMLGGSIPVVSSGGVSSFHDTAISDGPGVVIGRKGTLGRAHYVAGPFWPHDTTLWVSNFNGNHPRFVYYAIKGLDTAVMNVGSASPTLNRNDFHPLPVRWPRAVGEQIAVAEVLGALDDKIAANKTLVETMESMAVVQASPFESTVALGEIVVHHKRMRLPEVMLDDRVAHYSLPAFDAAHAPELAAPSMIKSGKFEVGQPAVLVSKLNPRFPRIWDVPEVGSMLALASTEFLVLESRYSSSTVLWSVVSQPDFSSSLESQVAGTSGSHQRVRPADLLATEVIDPRSMSAGVKDSITALGQCIASRRAESSKLAELCKTLLPELLSGRLRVKDAERVVGELV